jgi:hypothetical protein
MWWIGFSPFLLEWQYLFASDAQRAAAGKGQGLLQSGVHLQDVFPLFEGHVLGSKPGHEHGLLCHLFHFGSPFVYGHVQIVSDYFGYESVKLFFYHVFSV